MCGIAGLWLPSSSHAPSLPETLSSMGRYIRHRGPDDSGIWHNPENSIGFTHQRLAVLDLSNTGHQPMHSHSGRYTITYNGEIYNHLAIRHQLESAGLVRHRWRGQSDTETLLAAIDIWGLEFTLGQCSGMFSFGLWDHTSRQLFIARDRFGEKPLYYGHVHFKGVRCLAFASDLSALNAPGISFSGLDPLAVNHYFTYGHVSPHQSIHQDFFQLQPGCYAVFKEPLAKAKNTYWWDSAAIATSLPPLELTTHSSQSIIDQLHHTLSLVVKEQSISDVPLGTFLSGGIDSTLITSLLQAQNSKPVRTFTVSFPDHSSFNEGPFASSIASHLGTEHTDIPLTTEDLIDIIPLLPLAYSEPFADSSQVATSLVCRTARSSGLTVALSGDGGDELFGGYNRHLLLPRLYKSFSRYPASFRQFVSILFKLIPVDNRGLHRDKRSKLIAAIASSHSLELMYAAVTSIPNTDELLKPQWRHVLSPVQHSTLTSLMTLPEQVMLWDVLSYLPGDILAKVDRASMAASLETRAPFLDHRVAAMAWQMPLGLKISRRGESKWALRQILNKYIPTSLTDRPKSGFALPLGQLLCGPLKSWANDLLDPNVLNAQGFMNSQFVRKLWHEHLDGRDNTARLWTILMWQSWLNQRTM